MIKLAIFVLMDKSTKFELHENNDRWVGFIELFE